MEVATTTQRTAEWFAARCGCLTASKAAAILKRKKDGKPYQEYFDLVEKIIGERITGIVETTPPNAAMQWGTDHESEAREAYEGETGNLVEETGFVLHHSIPYFGASPDGLVDDDGLIEIKCPTTAKHLERFISKEIPEEYKAQMTIQLICTGRKWCDYVDYDPRLTGKFEKAQLFIKRFEPTEEEKKDATEKCLEFLEEVDKRYNKLVDGLSSL